jgi:hypothetical protein
MEVTIYSYKDKVQIFNSIEHHLERILDIEKKIKFKIKTFILNNESILNKYFFKIDSPKTYSSTSVGRMVKFNVEIYYIIDNEYVKKEDIEKQFDSIIEKELLKY